MPNQRTLRDPKTNPRYKPSSKPRSGGRSGVLGESRDSSPLGSNVQSASTTGGGGGGAERYPGPSNSTDRATAAAAGRAAYANYQNREANPTQFQPETTLPYRGVEASVPGGGLRSQSRPGTTPPPRSSPESGNSSDNSRSASRSPKQAWRSLKGKARELSPKRHPKIAAALEDPLAAFKKSRERKKAEREQAQEEKSRADLKAKISGPVDTGNVFTVDKIRPTPGANKPRRTQPAPSAVSMQQADLNVREVSRPTTGATRPQRTQPNPPAVPVQQHTLPPPPAEPRGRSEARTTRIGDLIEAGKGKKPAGSSSVASASTERRSRSRGASRFRKTPSPIAMRKPSMTSLLHRHKKSDDDGLEFECAGLPPSRPLQETDFEPSRHCVRCDTRGAFTPSGLCYECRPVTGMPREDGQTFSRHKRSSSVYSSWHGPAISYSDPGNPFSDSCSEFERERAFDDFSHAHTAFNSPTQLSSPHTSKCVCSSPSLLASAVAAGSMRNYESRDTTFYGFYDDILGSPAAAF